jgi:hypothetical protein
MRDTTTAHDPEESTATDHRYAGIELGEGFVVYDAAREDAWIQSDVSLAPAEVA